MTRFPSMSVTKNWSTLGLIAGVMSVAISALSHVGATSATPRHRAAATDVPVVVFDGSCPCADACAAAGCSDPCCPTVAGTCTVRPRCGEPSSNASLPQYLLFTRSTFGVRDASTHTPDYLAQPAHGIGASASSDGSLLVGNELIFSLFNDDINVSIAALRTVCASSVTANVPISVVLDTEQWWGAKPDLWNWWDNTSVGYDPHNVVNVEWYGHTNASAVKIGWRDWGSQTRVLPQQVCTICCEAPSSLKIVHA